MRLLPLSLLLGLALGASAGEPDAGEWTKEPDTAERQTLEKLKRRLERYPKAIPEKAPVKDALDSLNVPVVVDLGCGSVSVATKLRAWHAVAEKGGWYEWGGIEGGDETIKGKRRVVFINVLALDAKDFNDYEGRSLSFRVVNASILYHELLHAQLLIDAMRSDKKWRESFCRNEDFDFAAADLQDPHQRIPALQEAHRAALWELVKDVKDPF